jgi:hypothetical protein
MKNVNASVIAYFKGVIYDDNGASAYPGTLLGITPEVAIGTSTAQSWIDATFSSAVNLTAGDYWLGMVQKAYSQTADAAFFSTASAGTSGYESITYSSPANPLTSWANPSTYKLSVYATYTTAATCPLTLLRTQLFPIDRRP